MKLLGKWWKGCAATSQDSVAPTNHQMFFRKPVGMSWNLDQAPPPPTDLLATPQTAAAATNPHLKEPTNAGGLRLGGHFCGCPFLLFHFFLFFAECAPPASFVRSADTTTTPATVSWGLRRLSLSLSMDRQESWGKPKLPKPKLRD